MPPPPWPLDDDLSKREAGAIQGVAHGGDEATDIEHGGGALVGAQGPVALFDPPADGPLTSIVGPVQRLTVRSLPAPVARQPRPQIPAVQTAPAQPLGRRHRPAFGRRRGANIAMVDGRERGASLGCRSPLPDQAQELAAIGNRLRGGDADGRE